MTPFRPRRRRDGLLRQEVDGETLLYDEHRHRAICLDARAARVWGLCDGARDATAIRAELARTKEPLPVAAVAFTLRRLAAAGLLEAQASPRAGRGLSRRELIRQVGLAAIPVVLLITAPRARAAASGCASIGQACTVDTCCAGLTCLPGPSGLECQ